MYPPCRFFVALSEYVDSSISRSARRDVVSPLSILMASLSVLEISSESINDGLGVPSSRKRGSLSLTLNSSQALDITSCRRDILFKCNPAKVSLADSASSKVLASDASNTPISM